jgi:HK97 family phage prohead protease
MARPMRLCFRSVEWNPTVEGDGRTLEGYAAVFNTPTRIDSWEGKFDESIIRGAFAKTLNERKPVLQFDHGRDVRTGSVPIGSIQEIREDEKGLFVQARLFDNPTVEPIRQAIEGGAIDGMSFRFKVNQDDWYDTDGARVRGNELEDLLKYPGERGPLKRTIREVELYEAGPVVFPAYEATSVGVRSLMSMLSDEDRDTLLDELIERAAAKKPFPPKKKSSDQETDSGAAKKKNTPPQDADEEDEDDEEEDDFPPKKKKPSPSASEKPTQDPSSGGSKKPPAKKKKPAAKGAYSAYGMDWQERQRDLDLLGN